MTAFASFDELCSVSSTVVALAECQYQAGIQGRVWEGPCGVISGSVWTEVSGWRSLKPKQKGDDLRAVAMMARGPRGLWKTQRWSLHSSASLDDFQAKDAVP